MERLATIVGAIANPATNSQAPITHIESIRLNGSIATAIADRAPSQPAGRTDPPVHQPGDHSGDQAAGRPRAPAGGRRTPRGRARRRTRRWPPRRRRTGCRGPPRRRSTGPITATGSRCEPGAADARRRRRRGGVLGGEEEGPDGAGDDRRGEPGDGVPRGGEDRDEDRAGHEDHLVDRRLEGVRRVDLGAFVEHVRPPGADARADLGEGASGHGDADEGDPVRAAGLDDDHERPSAPRRRPPRPWSAPVPDRAGRPAAPAGSRGRLPRSGRPPTSRPRGRRSGPRRSRAGRCRWSPSPSADARRGPSR